MRSLTIAAASGAAATGFVHLVAALADDDSTAASRALQAGGLDRAKLSDLVARQRSATPPTDYVKHSPRVRWTLGVAHGLALAAGTEEDPTDVLLALLHDSSDEAAGVWRLVGVDPAQVRDHLAQTGIKTPTTPLPAPRTPAEKRSITFDAADWRPVVHAMFHAYPPGSTLRWGWNVLDDDRCHVTWRDYYLSVGVPADELDSGDCCDRLVDPEGRGPAIWFQVVPGGKATKNRLHLDLFVGGGRQVPLPERQQRVDGKVASLLAAGATTLRATDEADHYAFVLQDPEGNEFCVV